MKKKVALILASLFSVFALVGCSGNKVRLSYYDSTQYENGALSYNNSLFYKNNHETPVPDPCAIYIDDVASEYYGWFFLYGTIGGKGFSAYKSRDLYNWEPAGSVFSIDRSTANTEQSNAMYQFFWAPEVIFDKEDEKYHMFFSAGRRRLDEETGIWIEEKKHVAYHAGNGSN